METVIRALSVFLILLIILRLSGRRTFGQMTPFDFVLLLVISEATQEALIGDDYSITTAAIVIMTMVTADILLSYAKDRSRVIDIALDGQPMVLLENGKPLRQWMEKARIDEKDILQSARATQGLIALDQIKYAILETDGKISIIPAATK